MLHSFPSRAPSPEARRRFRTIIGLPGLTVVAALVLQYTPYHLLPARKTDTLWGILAGMAVMTAYAEYRWGSSTHRDRRDDER